MRSKYLLHKYRHLVRRRAKCPWIANEARSLASIRIHFCPTLAVLTGLREPKHQALSEHHSVKYAKYKYTKVVMINSQGQQGVRWMIRTWLSSVAHSPARPLCGISSRPSAHISSQLFHLSHLAHKVDQLRIVLCKISSNHERTKILWRCETSRGRKVGVSPEGAAHRMKAEKLNIVPHAETLVMVCGGCRFPGSYLMRKNTHKDTSPRRWPLG